jgi:iodotyrosine deiodinase
MSDNKFTIIEYVPPSPDELLGRSTSFRHALQKRRSVRAFSDRPVDRTIIEHLIMSASSAPSGANKQPWHFCAVSDPVVKNKIRIAAEKEEFENYHGRMAPEWLRDLEKFETNWKKEYLEIAPWLVIIFRSAWDENELADESGGTIKVKSKNYYVSESVGIAAGFFITAVHMAGLVTLPHTPSPMNFLQEILERPSNEKPFLLLPVGYPAEGVTVPELTRKSVENVITYF